MKFTGFENIDPAIRSIILITVAASYPAWGLGFEIGAYGRLFFDKLFVAWSISTALLVVMLFIPRSKLKVPKMAWYATVIPSLWLLMALAFRAAPEVKMLGQALTAIGFVAYAVCFPYVIYMTVSLAYPELNQVNRLKPGLAVGAIIALLVLAGFFAGKNHSYFLTCEDFEITGSYVPENCARSRPRL